MKPVFEVLKTKLEAPVLFASGVFDDDDKDKVCGCGGRCSPRTAAPPPMHWRSALARRQVEEMCADPAPGTVILLENLRMNIEETGKGEKDDKKIKADAAKVKKFKAHLRQLADVYINDAFGTAHRGHASMLGEGFAVRAAGSLMFKELDAFAKVIDVPARPVLAILGGAKVPPAHPFPPPLSVPHPRLPTPVNPSAAPVPAGERQDPAHLQHDRQGGRVDHWRRDGIHFPQGQR